MKYLHVGGPHHATSSKTIQKGYTDITIHLFNTLLAPSGALETRIVVYKDCGNHTFVDIIHTLLAAFPDKVL